MVKLTSKKATRHYVGMTVKPATSTASRFTITDEKDIVNLLFDDTVARLPAPTVMGGITLTKTMVVFSVDLSQYYPQFRRPYALRSSR